MSNQRRPRLLEKKESENPRLKENRRRGGNHRSFAARARFLCLFMNRKPDPKTTLETAQRSAPRRGRFVKIYVAPRQSAAYGTDIAGKIG